ncbi:hypothetical protein [Pseudonocardia sp. TMWB2A]
MIETALGKGWKKPDRIPVFPSPQDGLSTGLIAPKPSFANRLLTIL